MAKPKYLKRLRSKHGQTNAEVILESGRYEGARYKLQDGERVLFIPEDSELGYDSPIIFGAPKAKD